MTRKITADSLDLLAFEAIETANELQEASEAIITGSHDPLTNKVKAALAFARLAREASELSVQLLQSHRNDEAKSAVEAALKP